jgi:hypothetical protein
MPGVSAIPVSVSTTRNKSSRNNSVSSSSSSASAAANKNSNRVLPMMAPDDPLLSATLTSLRQTLLGIRSLFPNQSSEQQQASLRQEQEACLEQFLTRMSQQYKRHSTSTTTDDTKEELWRTELVVNTIQFLRNDDTIPPSVGLQVLEKFANSTNSTAPASGSRRSSCPASLSAKSTTAHESTETAAAKLMRQQQLRALQKKQKELELLRIQQQQKQEQLLLKRRQLQQEEMQKQRWILQQQQRQLSSTSSTYNNHKAHNALVEAELKIQCSLNGIPYLPPPTTYVESALERQQRRQALFQRIHEAILAANKKTISAKNSTKNGTLQQQEVAEAPPAATQKKGPQKKNPPAKNAAKKKPQKPSVQVAAQPSPLQTLEHNTALIMTRLGREDATAATAELQEDVTLADLCDTKTPPPKTKHNDSVKENDPSKPHGETYNLRRKRKPSKRHEDDTVTASTAATKKAPAEAEEDNTAASRKKKKTTKASTAKASASPSVYSPAKEYHVIGSLLHLHLHSEDPQAKEALLKSYDTWQACQVEEQTAAQAIQEAEAALQQAKERHARFQEKTNQAHSEYQRIVRQHYPPKKSSEPEGAAATAAAAKEQSTVGATTRRRSKRSTK